VKKLLLIIIMVMLGLLVVPLLPRAGAPQESGLTSAEIIARFAQAMGGQVKIDQLKTLRVGAVYPDHGDHSLFFEIRRPNMSYTPQADLVFDGERACLLRGMDLNSKPEMVDPADLVDFDVEIGYFFPAFFDFPSEYLGSDTVDGREVHKISPKLPHGAEMVYYIDSTTWLPYKVRTHLTIRGQSFDSERVYSDYKSVEGILYPHGFTYPGRDRISIMHGRVTSVEFNAALDEAHFRVPTNIK